MTVNSPNRVTTPAPCDGVVVNFPFTFKVFNATDLAVFLTDTTGASTLQTYTTNYSVALNSNQNTNPGGTVTMNVAPVAGAYITIEGNQPATQGTSLGGTNSGFDPITLENRLDYLTILVQQALEKVARAPQIPVVDGTGISNILPSAANRANCALMFDADGNFIVSVDVGAQLDAIAAYAAAAAASAAAAAQGMPFSLLNADPPSTSGGNSYGANTAGLCTIPLPATCAAGVEVEFLAIGAGGFQLSQAAGQSVIFGATTSTTGVGGNIASSSAGAVLKLKCITANTTYMVVDSQGNFSVT